MRILFMHPFPLGHSEAGQRVHQWALALRAAGHEVRVLLVDDQPSGADPFEVVRVTCRSGDATADLPFNVPYFNESETIEGRGSFTALSDRELAQYRDQLRRQLDAQIDRFDPHVIHVQYVWVQGQLALETGVPYVVNAWGPELIDYARDERYRSLADQAAENAGRILVPNPAVAQQVTRMFEAVADRVLVSPSELDCGGPTSGTSSARISESLIGLYQAALDERFGKGSS